MSQPNLTKKPIAQVGMLIRKPVTEVFEAFIDPEITTKFWFTKSTGRLEEGKEITWTWEMYNASAQVIVNKIEEGKKIFIKWGDSDEMTDVEWVFTPHEENSTYVSITNSGFQGDGDSLVEKALDALGGFTTVLDGAKAWLDHEISLNLILDKYPKGLTKHEH